MHRGSDRGGEVKLWWDAADRYREELRTLAKSRNWTVAEDIKNNIFNVFFIYAENLDH